MFPRLLSRFRPRRHCVGVDLGAGSIKVLRMELRNGMPTEAFAATRPTPRGAFENYMLADPVAVGAALREALSEVNGQHDPIALALPAPAVMIKRVTLAKTELGSVATRARAELAPLGSDRQDDIVCDFQIVGEAAGSEGVDLLIAGARRSLVDSYARALAQAKASLAVLDLDYFALQNLAEWYPEPPTRRAVLLLHGGFRYTAMNVVIGGRSIFTAGIEMGGKDIFSSPPVDRPSEPSESSSEKGRAEDPPKSRFTAEFCDEVHHTLNFYCSFLRDRPIDEAIFSGGLAHVPGLIEALAVRLAIPVKMATPLPLAGDGGGRELARTAEYAVAAGLVARGPGEE